MTALDSKIAGAEKAAAAGVATALGVLGDIVAANVLHGSALRYVTVAISILTAIATVFAVYEKRNTPPAL